jgi:hypothetical protein
VAVAVPCDVPPLVAVAVPCDVPPLVAVAVPCDVPPLVAVAVPCDVPPLVAVPVLDVLIIEVVVLLGTEVETEVGMVVVVIVVPELTGQFGTFDKLILLH